jgi:hypothetical protein
MPKKSAANSAAAPFVDPAAAAEAAAPNTVYSIDYVDAASEIVIKQGTTVIHRIPLSQLRSKDGGVFQNTAALIREQQGWNYLDSIKDGINIQLLQALNIYPESGNPQFTELHTWENDIIKQVNSNLSRRTWTKLYHTQEKDRISADYYLWESGMGKEHFMDPIDSTSTFGSFIDPLNKPGTVWPPVGQAIYLTAHFMNAIGFGESSIYAETIGNNQFKYCMKIACGNLCTGNNCIMNDYNQDQKYMKGNNEKAAMLKQSGNGQDKTKFVVIKEWGDKSQVVVDCILYHVMKNQNKVVVMSTCDIVVFILCIIFGIRCVFTGTFERPVDIDTRVLQAGNGSHYSIIDYFPGTPFDNEYQRLEQKITKTLEENGKIIASMEYLRANPSIEISVQGTSGTTFRAEFYNGIIADMTLINTELKDTFGPSITTQKKGDYASKTNIDQVINELRSESKRIDDRYLLVPIMKRKGNKLCMTLGKSYTLSAETRMKPSFNSADTFYNIGRKMNQTGQTGGAMPTHLDLEKFPESNHAPVNYTDQKQHQMYDTTSLSEMDEKMTENELPAAYLEDDKIYETDLQKNLDRTFLNSFTVLFNKNDLLYDSLYETLYTLYIYEAERDGMASPYITPNIIAQLSERHDVSISQIRLPFRLTAKYRRPNVQSPTGKHLSGRPVYTRSSPVPGTFTKNRKYIINPRHKSIKKLNTRRAARNFKILERRTGPVSNMTDLEKAISRAIELRRFFLENTPEDRLRNINYVNQVLNPELIQFITSDPEIGFYTKGNYDPVIRIVSLTTGGKRTRKHRKRNKTKKNRR